MNRNTMQGVYCFTLFEYSEIKTITKLIEIYVSYYFIANKTFDIFE